MLKQIMIYSDLTINQYIQYVFIVKIRHKYLIVSSTTAPNFHSEIFHFWDKCVLGKPVVGTRITYEFWVTAGNHTVKEFRLVAIDSRLGDRVFTQNKWEPVTFLPLLWYGELERETIGWWWISFRWLVQTFVGKLKVKRRG